MYRRRYLQSRGVESLVAWPWLLVGLLVAWPLRWACRHPYAAIWVGALVVVALEKGW
jgi:hypothetical protein